MSPPSAARIRAMARQYARACAEGDGYWIIELIRSSRRSLGDEDRARLRDVIELAMPDEDENEGGEL